MHRLICFILLMVVAPVFGQDSTGFEKVNYLPVPAFGYAPETKTYVGAVLLVTARRKDTLTRSSNGKAEFNYTWRKQVIGEIQWNHFTYREKWFTDGIIHFSKYPDKYYGIGSETPASNELNYESVRLKTEASVQKNLGDQWFAGLGVRYINYSSFLIQADTALYYPELTSANNTGAVIIISNDERNNILTPSKGHLIRFKNDYNFSKYFYSRASIDLRKYYSFKHKITHVFSMRFYSHHTFGSAPFYDLAVLGGDKFVRGYFYGRFRDDHLSLIQAEYRTHLFWRLGLSAFGGAAAIYRDFDWNPSVIKPNIGVGLRFLVDKEEGTNLRFDYAVGADGQNGFYVSFGESF